VLKPSGSRFRRRRAIPGRRPEKIVELQPAALFESEHAQQHEKQKKCAPEVPAWQELPEGSVGRRRRQTWF
jgi:hypothetical protein